jgi:hypothetical protein
MTRKWYFMTRSSWFLSLLTAATLAVIPASAEPTTYTFDVNDCSGINCLTDPSGPGPSNLPSVTLIQGTGSTAGTFVENDSATGSTATVEVIVNLPPADDADNSTTPFDEFAERNNNGAALGFNLSSGRGTVSIDLSAAVDFYTNPVTHVTTQNFTASTTSAGLDGTGTFGYQVYCDNVQSPPPGCHGGQVGNADQLTFVVSATNGVTLANFISNGTNYFSSDIAVFAAGGTSALGTGDIAADGSSGSVQSVGSTPEPATMVLSLFGLVLIGVRVSRRKHAIQ